MQNKSIKKCECFGESSWVKTFLTTDSELVNVELVAQLKTNFRLEGDVNCSHTQLPQLEWRILFSISMSVEVNVDVTTH